MAQQDYKPRRRKSTTRSSRSSASSGWAWLVVGLAIGLFGGFLFYLSKRPEPPHHDVFSLPASPKHAAKSSVKAQGSAAMTQNTPVAPEKPKFDFYTLLPKLQVDVPKPSHSSAQDHGQLHTPTVSTSSGDSNSASSERIKASGRYMLQVASFGTEGQANVLKAKLAFQGIVANVSPAKVKDYTWYRVQVGPYSNLTKLNAMLAQLAKENIKPLVIKMNG